MNWKIIWNRDLGKVFETWKESASKVNPFRLGRRWVKIFIVKESDIKINEGLIDESEVEDQITNLEVAICRTFIEIYDLNDGFKDTQ